MNLSYPLVGALAGGSALRVLGPDNPGRVTVSRSGTAMAFNAASALAAAPADTPRFSGGARRLLVEGARTNLLRNPRMEGAGAAQAPQYWNLPNMIAPLGPPDSENGIPCIDLACNFTAATNAQNLLFESQAFIPAVQGQVFTLSFFLRQISGSANGFSNMRLRFREALAGGGFLLDQWKDVAVSSIADGALAGNRYSFTVTVTHASAAFITAGFRLDSTATGAIGLRLGAPQVEQASFASSLMLPAEGVRSAASRAADTPVWTPPGGFGTQGTVVIKAMLPQLAPFGASQGLWQIDDGTDQNRVQLRNTSAGSAITGVVDRAGTTLATLFAGNMTPGTPFRAAFTWAPGDQALCLGGGTVQKASVSLPAGLARMLVGHASTELNRAAHGEVELVEYRPSRISDGMLQALANAA